MPSVSVNLPNRPKGEVITIPGLGGFPNGKVSDVDDAKFERFSKLNNHEGDTLVLGESLKPKPKPKTDPEPDPQPEIETDLTKEETSD